LVKNCNSWKLKSLKPCIEELTVFIRVKIDSLNEHGVFKGTIKGTKRILSCHPFKFLGGGEGFDPVKKKIK